MFGPLPRLHRMVVIAAAFVVAIAWVVWLAQVTPLESVIASGIGWGALAGLGLAYLLLHDFQHRPQRIRVERVRRR